MKGGGNMKPINDMSAWSWGNFVCGLFCGVAGGACALAGCSVDGPSPVADAALAKLAVGGGVASAAFVGGLAG